MCLVLTITVLLTSIIPVRIAITFHQAPVPQAIFVLGGNDDRMWFAAEFWRSPYSSLHFCFPYCPQNLAFAYQETGLRMLHSSILNPVSWFCDALLII